MNCDRCSNPSKVSLKYGPHHFCGEHFSYFFERRIKKTIKKYGLIGKKEKIAIGVSGGKDSMVTLHLLNSTYGKGHEINAVMIDEGIEGYRNKAIKVGEAYCNENKIPYEIVKYQKELGHNMDSVMEKIQETPSLGSSCSFCGVFRRTLMNSTALKWKADKFATGHNLDDEIQSILMNLFNNDLPHLARLGAISNSSYEGFVPRIKPLYETPEQEVVAYAAFNEIKHYSNECCPYCHMAQRNQYRELINTMEQKTPAFKFNILQTFLQLKPLLQGGEGPSISECINCNRPSTQKMCNVCVKLAMLKEAEVKSVK